MMIAIIIINFTFKKITYILSFKCIIFIRVIPKLALIAFLKLLFEEFIEILSIMSQMTIINKFFR